MIRQYELVERVRHYNPQTDETLLNKAYVFAMRAHGMQKRANGDPYFSHPIEVAFILTELRMDDVSIVTALLHDTIEDTYVSRGDIAREFGEEIATLVDGVTKLTKLELADIDEAITENEKQAENFRKLLLAVADDIRVLLVKLADRLHNMRTLNFIKNPEKRMRIARETQELYAPLAGRIGVQFIREELEDLSFRNLNPDVRDSIVSRLENLKKNNPELIQNIEAALCKKTAEKNIKATMTGRLKSPYSIYEKMRKQDLKFEQLADVIGFRIIVGTVDECYMMLGVVHQNWTSIPGRFKDYISMQKRNGYQSIHTTIMMYGHKVEIQIRTQKMHDFAEHGVAAHWGYKQNEIDDVARYGWIHELIDYMKEGGNALDLLEFTKMEIFHDRVFCFTPKGRIIRLPRGATAIDFAYAVHSDVGDKCAGVKINGIRVPLRTALQNGDSVTIITSPQAVPSSSWEDFATTGKAKGAIRRFIRNREKEQYIKLGRSLIQRQFAMNNIDMNEETMELLRHHAKASSNETLFYSIGYGTYQADVLFRNSFPDLDRTPIDTHSKRAGEDAIIHISGLLPGVAIHLRHCCFPLPGDRIVGLFKEAGGVDVHAIDCNILAKYEDSPDIWIDLRWDGEAHDKDGKPIYSTRIIADLSNEPGVLGQIATLIGRHNGNIANLNVTERKTDYYRFIIDLEVYDLKHLQNILNVLRASPQVTGIERLRETVMNDV